MSYPPWGSTSDVREPSWLGFSFRRFELVQSPISVPQSCFLLGRTLALENSAGVPGHIGHFAENVIKYFSFVDVALGIHSITRIWTTGRGSGFPVNEWELHLLKASIGLRLADPLPPNSLLRTPTNCYLRAHKCALRRRCLHNRFVFTSVSNSKIIEP